MKRVVVAFPIPVPTVRVHHSALWPSGGAPQGSDPRQPVPSVRAAARRPLQVWGCTTGVRFSFKNGDRHHACVQ